MGGGDERCEGMGIIIEGEDRKGSIAGEGSRSWVGEVEGENNEGGSSGGGEK